MPYITKKDRKLYDKMISDIVFELINKLPGDNGCRFAPGDLNYIISSIVWQLFDKLPSYTRGNKLVGVLECVKQEFLRRRLNIYEDLKIKENGDL